MDSLESLLRQARTDATPAEMPFGFDTRVLALAHASAPNGSAWIAHFAQRASALALILIGVAAIGVYQSANSATSNELSSDYSLADTAIENNLSE